VHLGRRHVGVACGVVVALVIAACSAGGGSSSSSPTTVSYGSSGLLIPPSTGALSSATTTAPAHKSGPASGTPGAGATGLRITLVNGAGNGLPGLVAAIIGPSGSFTATSNSAGVIALAVPPGSYIVTVAQACTEFYRIEQTTTAQVGVPAGQVVSGRLDVTAVNRVAAAPPAFYQRISPAGSSAGPEADWQVGQTYSVTFGTTDRCTNANAAGESLGMVKFVTGAGYALVGAPPAAVGPNGMATIDVGCTAPGKTPVLLAEAKLDNSDQLNLFSPQVLYGQVPTCSSTA